jgi:hypothetical protein
MLPLPSPAAPDGTPTTDVLAAIAVDLVARAGLDPQLPTPVAVGLTPARQEIAVRPLGGDDPLATLLGEVAPDHWWAVGVVAAGRAWVPDPDGPTDPGRDRGSPVVERVLVAHLVARDGSAAAVLQPYDGAPGVLPMSGGEASGRTDDLLRRMLGLDTPEPTHDVAELWALQWLDGVLAAAAWRGPGTEPLTWSDVAGRHPAAALAGRDAWLRTLVDRDLARLGRAFARVTTWTVLRTECATGRWHVPGLAADDAAWLDDGAFSRWVMRQHAFCDEYLEDLQALLSPRVMSRLEAVLAEWDLPG